MRGQFFTVTVQGDKVYKKARFEKDHKRALQIHQDLEDIKEILPVVEDGKTLIQPLAKGVPIEGYALKGEDKEHFERWLQDFTKRVAEKGYKAIDVKGIGNVYRDGNDYYVVDVESFVKMV